MTMRLEKGSFRVKGGDGACGALILFEAGSLGAAVSVRGSSYAARLDDRGITVVFLGGKEITVTTERGSVRITKPSFATNVVPGAAPGRLRRMPAAELTELTSAGSGDGKEHADEGNERMVQAGELARWGYWDIADGASGDISSRGEGRVADARGLLAERGSIMPLVGFWGSAGAGRGAETCPGGT
jgi:hypothetical protein